MQNTFASPNQIKSSQMSGVYSSLRNLKLKGRQDEYVAKKGVPEGLYYSKCACA